MYRNGDYFGRKSDNKLFCYFDTNIDGSVLLYTVSLCNDNMFLWHISREEFGRDYYRVDGNALEAV